MSSTMGMGSSPEGNRAIGAVSGAGVTGNNAMSSGSAIAGMFSFDSSGVKALHTDLQNIITDIGLLDTKVKGLVGSLGKAGLGGSGSGSTGLSAAPISTPGSSPGTAPSTTTGGAFSGLRSKVSGLFGGGSVDRTLALGAGAEVAAQGAGWVNNKMSTITSAGVSFDLVNRQNATMYGGGTAASVGRQYTLGQQMKGLSMADITQAQIMQQGNPFLTAGAGSKTSNTVAAFSNAMQNMSPLMSASGAMGFANTLTSPQFLQAASHTAEGAMGGGLLNARTGGLNNPNQTMKSLVEMIAQTTSMSSARAKQIGVGSSSSGGNLWAQFSQNAQSMGITDPGQLQAIHQYLTSGMNPGAVAGSTAASGLKRATAGAHTQMTITGQTTDLQNATNNAAAALQRFTNTVLGMNSVLSNALMGGGMVASSGLGIAGLAAKGKILGGVLGKGGSRLAGGGSKIAADGSRVAADAVDVAGGASRTLGAVSDFAGPAGLAFTAATMSDSQATALGHIRLAGRHGGKEWNGGWEARQQQHGLGDPTGSTTTGGMQPDLARKVNAMRKANPRIQISSGHRTAKQQATLYAMKGGHQVAKPGMSAHQTGKAADLGPASQLKWISQNAGSFGLYHPAPSQEPWHVQSTMGDPVAPVSGLTQGRVDQGVDYSGNGSVVAVADGTVVRASASGWGSLGNAGLGACIVLKLDNPPDPQHTMVYYAESIVPSVKVGQHVKAGDVLGQVTGAGVSIEIGWSSTTSPGSPLAPLGSNTGAVTAEGTNFLNWVKGAKMSGDTGGGAGGGASGAPPSASASSGLAGLKTNAPGGILNNFISSVGGSWLAGNSISPGSGLNAGSSSSSSSPTAPAAGGGGGSSGGTPGVGSSSVVAAVKAITSDRNIQLAMLTGAALESNQNPGSVGSGSYGAWQIQMLSGRDVTPAQAKDPAFAAKFMLGSYSSAVSAVPKSLWKSDPSQAAEQAAYAAERPAQTYYASQGPSRVAAAYNLAASEVGGPMGDPSGPSMAPMSSGGGSPSMVSGGGGRGFGGHVTLSMPIQVVGSATAQDATNLVQMVMAKLKSEQGLAQLGSY